MFNFSSRKKLRPDIDSRAINEVRYVVLDTELTGLDEKRDSIVSIGTVSMIGGRIELGSGFYRLVNPRTELTPASIVIHQITPSEVETEPGIAQVLGEFLDVCGSDILVGHFISIDLAFLNREMKRVRGQELLNVALDTFSLYEWLRKRNRVRECSETGQGYQLYDIAKCFDVPVNGAHNAIMDAFTTAQLFQQFLSILPHEGADTIDDLLRIGTPFKGGDNFRQTIDFCNF